MAEKKSLIGLRRGIEVLRLLSRSPEGLTFSVLQKSCTENIGAPTLSRLLKALIEEQLITKNETNTKYLCGPAFLDLIGARKSISETVTPAVEVLAERSGQSSAFFLFENKLAVLRAKTEQPDSYHYMPVHGVNTTFKQPFFLMLIAYLDKDKREHIASRCEDFQYEIFNGWHGALDRAAEENLLVSTDLMPECPIKRIIGPVFKSGNELPVGSVGISMYNADPDRTERYKTLVRLYAQHASGLLDE